MAGPAGAIVSSAQDMSKWMLFHLNGGRTSTGASLVTSEGLQETYKDNLGNSREQTDHMKLGEPVHDVHVAYNLGWITNYYKGIVVFCSIASSSYSAFRFSFTP